MLKYGTNKGLIWYFWARILKNYCDFLNEHSQLFLVAKCCEKTKMAKFGTQNALFWYFCARILKHSCHIWNRHPHVFLVAEFCEKTKMPKNGSKNTLFEFFFLAWIWKRYFRYLKAAPWNLLNCKISRKNKKAKIWD